MDVLLKSYMGQLKCENGKFLINVKSLDVNLDMLLQIFYNLAKSEDYFFKNVFYRKQENLKQEIIKQENVYIYDKDVILYNKIDYKIRYYSFYGISDIDDACKQYLIGLYWILGYYNNHMHNNWSWYYKYDAVPFISDIYNYFKNNKYTFLREMQTYFKSDSPNTQFEQLLMVLPKKSLIQILSNKDVERITNCNYLSEYYPDNIVLDMINKKYLWQSKVFLKKDIHNILFLFT